MRRGALSEWGAIVALALSPALFIYWAISIALPGTDFEFFLPFGHWQSMQVLASGGRITVNDHPGSSESIEVIQRAVRINPTPTGIHRWALPGLRFRCVTWPSGAPVWSVDFSLLIPTFLTAVVAMLCVRRYRRIRRMRAHSSAGTSRLRPA
jgi:hypothetical protein